MLRQKALIRGTQRLFSVKYLFEEVDNRSLEVFIACLDDRSTDMMYDFQSDIYAMNSLRFLKFNFSHLPPQVKLYFVEKETLDLRIRECDGERN